MSVTSNTDQVGVMMAINDGQVSSERQGWEPLSSDSGSGPEVTRVTFPERRADDPLGKGSGVIG